jgi:hypothetical protein
LRSDRHTPILAVEFGDGGQVRDPSAESWSSALDWSVICLKKQLAGRVFYRRVNVSNSNTGH